jgi:hypothetical protein
MVRKFFCLVMAGWLAGGWLAVMKKRCTVIISSY